MDQRKLQTGSRRGTIKGGTEHPEFSDLVFQAYRVRSQTPGHGGPEQWNYREKYKLAEAKRQQRIKDGRERKKLWISEYKTEKGCAVCGYNKHSYCLDLDHIDPKTKTHRNTAGRLAFKPMEEIKELVNSNIYQVLCAICHRIKTYGQKEHYNKAYAQS
jgi:hypothetical protein